LKKKIFILAKALVFILLICNKVSYGQSIASEDFSRANILSGTSPVSWSNANSSDPGFTTTTGSFTGNALTYNIPTAGTSRIMSAVLGGSTFNFNNAQPAYEWTFLYQAPASGVTVADNSGAAVSGNNWRFWFNATGSDPTASGFKGYYVAQDGNFLKFYYWCRNCGSRAQVGSSVAITPGSKYIIRGVRQSNNGGTYLFYATQYTGSSSFPTTAVNSAEFDQVGSYTASFFQTSASTGNSGVFQWDNLNFYQATITLSGLNNVGTGAGGNGIAAFLTQGDSQKAVFGFKATALGSVTMTQADFSWSTTGSGNSFYFNNAKLYYSSGDDVYTPAADDSSLGSVTLNSGSASISSLTEAITNSSRNYFLVVDVQNYASATANTASIGLTDVKITGNAPITIAASVSGTSFTLPATPITWTGGTSTVWTLAGNWNGGAPTTSSSVIIPTGLSRYPILTGNQTVGTLSMTNGNLDLGGFVLSVTSSVLGNGTSTITGTGNSYLNITGGSGDRSISGTGLSVTNLKIDLPLSTNTFTIYGTLKVSNLLTMTKGILASGGNLTLTSTSTTTANIDAIPATASITGTVNVQRFITGGSLTYRGYRLLSSPISDATATNYYNLSYLKGSGSYLTGAANGGFDVTGNPTLYLYREDRVPDNSSFTSGNYRPITKIDNSPAYNIGTADGSFNLPVGVGYMYFFRGNNTNIASNAPGNITLTTSGRLNQGQITVKNWVTGSSNLFYSSVSGSATIQGFNLVGNPYPCAIDWNKHFGNASSTTDIYAPNVGHAIYVYNTTTKNYSVWTSSSTTTGSASGSPGGSNIIPSGQGFFVKASSGSAQLIFNESAKVSAQPGTLLLNVATPPVDRHIRLQLEKDSINKDETVIIFNSAAKPVYNEDEDVVYLKGSGPISLSNLSADNFNLTINSIPFQNTKQVIPLNVAATSSGVYKINATEIANIPDMFDVWLMDSYKKDSLDIKHNPTYSFNITSDAASAGANRFKLVITLNPLKTLHLLNFTGEKTGREIKLSWAVENEGNSTKYVLERSIDGGKNFIMLDSLTSANLGVYTDLDPNPVKGQNLYRLKQVDVTGNISYSSIVPVMYADNILTNLTANLISVYPNPVKAMLNVAITPATTETANYKITITNTAGIIVKSSTSTNPNWQGDISSVSPGTYFIQVVNTKNNTLTGKSTFVKL
jgi:hypothetical protein